MEVLIGVVILVGMVNLGGTLVDIQREEIAQLEQEVQECRADNEDTE